VAKNQMTRHLNRCEKRQAQLEKEGRRGRKGRVFHLVVEGRYDPEYWLHIEVNADSEFADLDAFLRDIWLECCGHLSDFELPKRQRRTALDLSSLFSIMAQQDDFGGIMGERIGGQVEVGDEFYYTYDFGSSTELKLRVVGEREGRLARGEVQLLARNVPPKRTCECGEPAKYVCTECMWDEDGGWLCGRCARQHDCGEEMLLPVVNSPRCGVCGYTG